jgi:hypothetical protein
LSVLKRFSEEAFGTLSIFRKNQKKNKKIRKNMAILFLIFYNFIKLEKYGHIFSVLKCFSEEALDPASIIRKNLKKSEKIIKYMAIFFL